MNKNLVQRQRRATNVGPMQSQQPQMISRRPNTSIKGIQPAMPPYQNRQPMYQEQDQSFMDQNDMNDTATQIIRGSKMSVQNAITLITLRLGRIETFTQKLQSTNVLEKITSNDFSVNESISEINDDMINNILEKLNTLETTLNNFVLNFNNMINVINVKINLLETNTMAYDNNFKLLNNSINENLNAMNNEIVMNKNNNDYIFNTLTIFKIQMDKMNDMLLSYNTTIDENGNTSITMSENVVDNENVNVSITVPELTETAESVETTKTQNSIDLSSVI